MWEILFTLLTGFIGGFAGGLLGVGGGVIYIPAMVLVLKEQQHLAQGASLAAIIATAIVGDYFQGVGFAIPSSIAREVYGRLKSSGKFERGLLGVRVQNLTADTADRLQIPRKGVWVTSVERDSLAWQSGIRMDDVVIDWNGQAVNDFRELRLEVARTPIGSEAKVTIRRGENTMTLKVTVGRRRDP